MSGVRPHPLPSDALLRRYAESGAYTDCYAVELKATASHARYVEAFYTTRLFKLERLLLALFAGRPSSDADAARLACGEAERFAAWRVEARAAGQLLLRDFSGRTCSWLMTEAIDEGRATRLLFGSAVVPLRDASGTSRMGGGFAALMGFHKLYSRLLLAAAWQRLSDSRDDADNA